jgi:phospholipase C
MKLRNSRREFLQIGLAAAAQATPVNPSKIRHIIVLMLENRSFDHMLAFSGVRGTELPHPISEMDGAGQPVPLTAVKQTPDTNVDPDPDHDFESVMMQLYGRKTYDATATPGMDNFVRTYQMTCQKAKDSGDHPNWSAADIVRHSHNVMACHPRENVPILTFFAENYALCTNWYSSLPGPTLPNRLFAHLGTSMGRVDMAAFDLDTPKSVYEVLSEQGVSSTIYSGGWSIGATFRRLLAYQDQYFGTLDDFYQDCADNDLPGYCFLEPRYGPEIIDSVYRPQNDQHPDSDLRDGEELILSVYHAIRSRREIWESSLLIITYDEHGGICDHRPPPAAIPPDHCVSCDPPFDFTRYGVRVPAVIVSPYTPRMIIDDICDHTSLIACARKRLTGVWQDDKLGKRAQHAYPLDKAFGPRRPDADEPPRLKPWIRRSMRPRTMNHLQEVHVEMAKSVEQGLPAHRRTGIDPSKIKTDQQAQHYVSRVYAHASGFPSPRGRKCGC